MTASEVAPRAPRAQPRRLPGPGPAGALSPRRAPASVLSVSGVVVHSVPGRVRLRIPQLKTDPHLAQRVTAHVERQSGVLSTRVNAACSSLVVSYDPQVTNAAALVSTLRAGVPITPMRARPAEEPSGVPLVCGILALGAGLLGAPALVAGGLLAASSVPVLARAIASLKDERQLSADALDATAIGILAAQGNVVAASLSAALIAGGEYIRALTARRSRGALTALLGAQGWSAWVLRGNRKERVPAESLEQGDVIVAYSGELLVADGLVLRGRALVDQKTLTGESVPVLKTAGAEVFASTTLTDGKLYVRVEQVGNTTRASRILQLLENAPMHDTRLANHARRFADRLVAPTFLLAGGLLIGTGDLSRAISVLIIDFATGIRVSAPTTVLASMTAAVRQDILVKGGRALEQLARVDTLVFDKTGTLTAGTPRVTLVGALADGVDQAEVLALAAAAEQRLTHPAAQAIVDAALGAGVRIPERADSHFAVGLGVAADVGGVRVLVGSARYLEQQGVHMTPSARGFATKAGHRGASTVFVARDGQLVGAVCYADRPRPEARAVLEALRARGIKELIMLTGDTTSVAEVVAGELGVDRFEAEVFPERKAELVRALQAAGRVVGMVGDGINDSPALAYADVSISLKAASDVARETADIVLHGDLQGLPVAIDLARDAMSLIRQNLAIVAAPNGVGIGLAALGVLGPVAATAINNGSNVAAALNGLRPLVR